MTERIVFVCSGNICRSPMGAGLATAELEARDQSGVVISCGTLKLNGRPAASNAILAMAELGYDISSHYSQGVDVGLLKMADHIVVMAPQHERFLVGASPALAGKIVRMWAYSETPLSQIHDPVGRDLEAFRTCRDVLVECVGHWLDEVFSEPES